MVVEGIYCFHIMRTRIAQSKAATGKNFVNYWMHGGYLQVNAEKMSKSLKNFLTIREILDTDSDRQRIGEVLRFLFLSSHYRSPLNYSDQSLENARMGLRRIYLALQKVSQLSQPGGDEVDERIIGKFRDAMNDDFNTPDAIAVIFDCVRQLNRAVESKSVAEVNRLHNSLRDMTESLGVVVLTPARFLGLENTGAEMDQIRQLVTDREIARRARNWAKADQIRQALTNIGVEIEDRRDGTTTWRKTQG